MASASNPDDPGSRGGRRTGQPPSECENRSRRKPDASVFGYEDRTRNLLKNWNFEDPISDDNWRAYRSSVTRSSESHTGNWSLHVHNREHKHGHAYQRIYTMKPSTCYYFSLHIKLLNHPDDHMFFNFKVFLRIKYTDSEEMKMMNVARSSFQTAPSPWKQFGGDLRTPDRNFDYVEFHMDLRHTDVDYLLDTTSLIELLPDPKWKRTANRDIRKYRKSPVQLNVKLPKRVDPKAFKIKITQKKRDFGFGSAISADYFNGDNERGQKYRDFFLRTFEWAVFCNDTKWKCMETLKGQIKFARVDKALELLHQNGITVRGHAIHWNNKLNNPAWARDLQKEELQEEIDRRVHYVVSHYKGKFVQWDVCNEHLHNRWFEEVTGNPDHLTHLFRTAHELDPECRLYLNDYLVLRSGDMTSALAGMAKDLLADGVPVHGIGVQSHLRVVPIQYEILKKRLDIIASAGLPIMATELSVHTRDVSQRARSLEQALYAFFSHPQVLGVILWHFSDQGGITLSDDMPLFEGPDFEPNEAGRVLLRLLAKWRTNKPQIRMTKNVLNKRFRAYHGDYELEVLHKGRSIWGQSFRVEKGQVLNIDIQIDPEHVKGSVTGRAVTDEEYDDVGVDGEDDDDDDEGDEDDDDSGDDQKEKGLNEGDKKGEDDDKDATTDEDEEESEEDTTGKCWRIRRRNIKGGKRRRRRKGGDVE